MYKIAKLPFGFNAQKFLVGNQMVVFWKLANSHKISALISFLINLVHFNQGYEN